MDQVAISSLVRDNIAGYRYEPTREGTTVGVPWSSAKTYDYVEKLKAALVDPYLQRFELRETYKQAGSCNTTYADFWVVAEGDGGYLEWYDPATGEFGLGIRREGSDAPVSIGLRGDLMDVFCAM